MNISEKYKIPKERPAYHVDEHFNKAASKAAQAFREEEEELQKTRLCKGLKESIC